MTSVPSNAVPAALPTLHSLETLPLSVLQSWFEGRASQIYSILSPKRDCGSETVKDQRISNMVTSTRELVAGRVPGYSRTTAPKSREYIRTYPGIFFPRSRHLLAIYTTGPKTRV